MRSFLNVCAFLLVFFAFGQSIIVNSTSSPESSLSAEELTIEVLIDGGECSTIENFQLHDNPSEQFPKVNRSWGYFEKGSSDFPFEKGIVLTSGYAKRAEGPDTEIVSDGNYDWTGDDDAYTLGGGGFWRESNNATVFEFDFIPFGNEISFNYIFASEEYPQWACGSDYNDVFGFIISGPGITNDPGLSGKNIALLPNGNPVTIQNVNDEGCGDDTYYVPGQYMNPFIDIQYGGRTAPLTAYSEVIPNETYHIRLLVSDIGDFSYDSAVFLEAGSFNLGANISDIDGDILGASKALCDLEEYVLVAHVGAENAIYQWYFNGEIIPGATEPTYTATESGHYSVEIAAGSCATISEIDLIFSFGPEANIPPSVSVCSETGSHIFDLTEYNSQITTDPNVSFKYYNTEEGALLNDPFDLIVNSTAFEVTGTQTVYIRITNMYACFTVVSLTLIADEDIEVHIVDEEGQLLGDELVLCQTDEIKLYADINQPGTEYKWYFNGEVIPGATGQSITVTNSGVYSVEIVDGSCEATTEINVLLAESPEVNLLDPIFACGIEGAYSFDLSEYYSDISEEIDVNFSFFYSQAGAETADPNDEINDVQDFEVIGDIIIYVRVENEEGCYSIVPLELNVGTEAETVSYEAVVCGADGADSAVFNLLDYNDEVLPNGSEGLEIEYYLDEDLTQLIADPANFTNTSNPQTVYVKIVGDGTDTFCESWVDLTLLVDLFPAIQSDEIDVCDNMNEGNTTVDLTQNEIVQSQGINVSLHYYETVGGPEITDPTNYTVTDETTVIHVVIRNQSENCEDYATITVNLNDAPALTDEVVILLKCGLSPYDTFYLPSAIENMVLNPDEDFNVTFYLNIENAINGNNPLPENYTNVTPDQIVFARVENEFGCYDIGEIQLSVNAVVEDYDGGLQVCNDPYEINDGTAGFDLTQMNNQVEIELDGHNYDITFYTTLEAAMNGVGAISDPYNYENQSNPQTIFARASSGADGCDGVVSFRIQVLEVPEMDLQNEIVFCSSDAEKIFEFEGDFQTYTWYNPSGEIISDERFVEFGPAGTYTLEVTQNGLECPAMRDIEVIYDMGPIATQIDVNGNTVVINATGGIGPYKYSFDNGLTWIDYHTIPYLPSGIYNLIIQSANGCLSDPIQFAVLSVPNVITPNGDGINDYWEIRGLEFYTNVHLRIFDRYGKMFVDRPWIPGFRWDGTYMGDSLPSGDYWYILNVEDMEPIYGHITIKNQ